MSAHSETDDTDTTYEGLPTCYACGESVSPHGEHYRLQTRQPYNKIRTPADEQTYVEVEWEWGPDVLHFHKECLSKSDARDPPAYRLFHVVEAESGVKHALISDSQYGYNPAQTVCKLKDFTRDDGRPPESKEDLEQSITCGNCQRGLSRAMENVVSQY